MINYKRLESGACLMDMLKPKNLKMDYWSLNNEKELKSPDCNTSACFCGWCTTFIKNLTIKPTKYSVYQLIYKTKNKTYMGIEAATKCFRLSLEQAEYLFEAESYPSKNPLPSTVAKRVREFIKKERAKCSV